MATPRCFKVHAYGAKGSILNGLGRMEIDRFEPRGDELRIQILYCGVCHSDLHQVRNEWKNTLYPCVPGHEIVGRVIGAGGRVKRFKVGDIVGVGCMIDSCGKCSSCRNGEENYCSGPVSWTATYNGYAQPDGSKFNTFGGYSSEITVRESFVLRIPKNLDHAAAAPIMCAGVTTYSPLKHWKAGKGMKVAVVGLGGLGHMAVKLARALGAEVSVVTSTESKSAAARKLGAKQVLVSTHPQTFERNAGIFNLVLNTIPDPHDPNPYVKLVKRDGALVTAGLVAPYAKPIDNNEVVFQRRSIAGTLIGSVRETQEVLDFCAKHRIAPDIELIPIQRINEAFEAMTEKEVRFRYVIDMASLRGDTTAIRRQANDSKRLAAL